MTTIISLIVVINICAQNKMLNVSKSTCTQSGILEQEVFTRISSPSVFSLDSSIQELNNLLDNPSNSTGLIKSKVIVNKTGDLCLLNVEASAELKLDWDLFTSVLLSKKYSANKHLGRKVNYMFNIYFKIENHTFEYWSEPLKRKLN